MEKNNNRFNNIIKDLKSDDTEKVLTAIKQLRLHGQKEAIAEVLAVFIETTNEEVKKSITNLLFDLKKEDSVLPIIKAINDKKYASIKPFLISIFWQSSLDASEHLGSLVRIASKGDYNSCLEVLTVIETFDTSFDEDQIMDAVYDIEEKLDDYEIDEEYRKLLYLLKETVSSLKVEY
jgi:HEAT repeat protein